MALFRGLFVPVAFVFASLLFLVLHMFQQSLELVNSDDAMAVAVANHAISISRRSSSPRDLVLAAKQRALAVGGDEHARMLRLGLVRPEVVSWRPRVTVLHNFLSDEECDEMIRLSARRLEPSMVADLETGEPRPDKWRNSSGSWLSPDEERRPSLKAVSQRISHFTGVPPENMEPAQILRYRSGEYYKVHEDFLLDENSLKLGQRVATVLMYLTNGVVGGETWFPEAGAKECPCGGETKQGVSVAPSKGKAVLFWNVMLNGSIEERSTHAGCPVLGGEKWSATKWLCASPVLDYQ